MRAILHGFHEPMHQPILDALVKDLRVQYCQLTYSGHRQTIPDSITSVIHYWWDLNWGQYHVDRNTLRPLDEALLSGLSDAEVVFLKMCDSAGVCPFRSLISSRKKPLSTSTSDIGII